MKLKEITQRFTVYFVFFSALSLILSNMVGVFVSPWVGFFHEYMASISLLFLYCATLLLSPYYKINTIFLLIAFIAFIPLIQNFFDVVYFSGDALIISAYIFGAAIAIFCGCNLACHGYGERSFYLFFLTLVVLGLANSFLSLYQFFDLKYAGHFILDAKSSRVYGNLAQPNNLATFFVISLFSSWFLFEKKVLSFGVFVALSCLFLFCLSLPQSRTTLLIFVSVFGLYLFFKSNVRLRLPFLYFLFVAFVYWTSLSFQEFWLENQVRDFSISGIGSSNLPPRIAIWNDIVIAVIQGPLWGYGWGQVSVAQILGADGLSGHPVSYSHNILLDLLVWNGPIVGVMIISLFAYFIVKILIACKSVEAFFGVIFCCAIGVHAFLELPLTYTFFIFPFFFVFGLLVNNIGYSRLLFAFPCYVFASIFILFQVVIYRDYIVVVNETRESSIYALNNLSGDRDSRLDEVIILNHLSEYIRFKDTDVTDSMTEEKIEWMKKVSHRFPAYSTLMKYRRACTLNGYDQEADRVYLVVQRLFVRKAKS